MPFERWLDAMKKPWIIACLIGIVILSFLYADRAIAYYFNEFDLRHTFPVIHWITLLGVNLFYLVFLLLLTVFFRFFYPKKEWAKKTFFLWLCVVIPATICTVLKLLLGRARPELLINDHMYGFYGFNSHHAFWSMPSGHTTTVMGLAFGLSILYPRYRYVYLSIALIVALMRVLLLDHYLSDVLVASLLAFYEVALISYALKP
jgi:membrane-associated phospholipid phosphatase